MSDAQLEGALARFKVSAPYPVADTASSRVFRVMLACGEPAALKLLKTVGVADEFGGADALRWFAGDGAVRLIDAADDAHLLEWVDGAQLVVLCRERRDAEASAILCDIINRLHTARKGEPPAGLTGLERRFRALLEAEENALGAKGRSLLRAAQTHARALLDTATESVPLHGDLHHFNILASRRGWLAIDPKGLVGDPTYDVANLFRNPDDMPELIKSPRRIERLADALVRTCAFDMDRVLRFAVAHAGLSAVWDLADRRDPGSSLSVLPVLLDVLGAGS